MERSFCSCSSANNASTAVFFCDKLNGSGTGKRSAWCCWKVKKHEMDKEIQKQSPEAHFNEAGVDITSLKLLMARKPHEEWNISGHTSNLASGVTPLISSSFSACRNHYLVVCEWVSQSLESNWSVFTKYNQLGNHWIIVGGRLVSCEKEKRRREDRVGVWTE